jgi:hypothetical protein
MRKVSALVAMMGLGAIVLPLAAAHATIAIPGGTPFGAAMDSFTLSGTYDASSMPSSPAQPFAATPFSLTLTLPAEVSLPYSVSEFTLPVSGSYTNAGQTETFSGQTAFFGSTSGATALNLTVAGLLFPGDTFSLQTTSAPLLYQPLLAASVPITDTGLLYQLATGTLSNVSGSATYNPPALAAIDPTFSGTITVAAGVPEPASWALLPAGLLALGAAVRRSRRV